MFVSVVLIATPLFGATFNVSTPAQFQTALTAAQSNGQDDVINVEAGTYNITATLTYSTPSGDGGHKLNIQGDDAGSTILDGGGNVRIMSIDTDNNHDGGDLGGDVTITGLTFRNGEITGSGAGVIAFSNSAAIILTSNTFTGNSDTQYGGGAYVQANGSGAITLTNNTFSGNSSGFGGGGAYVVSESGAITLTGNTFTSNSRGGVFIESYESGPITLTSNTFTSNSSTDNGGGAYLYADESSVMTLTNNTFANNSSDSYGGGLFGYSIVSGTITLTNNIFSGNSADSSGGGASLESDGSGAITLTNNTFTGNDAASYGGGVIVYLYDDNTPAYIYNNIFWANVASFGGNDGEDLYVNADYDENGTGSAVELFNNDFSGNANFTSGQSEDLYITNTGNYSQGNNIQTDPLFVNAGAGDFHLQSGSPAINTGDNSAPSLPATDFDGKPRIINVIVDMGAFEYGPPATSVPAVNEWGMLIFMVWAGLEPFIIWGDREKQKVKEVLLRKKSFGAG